MEELKIMCDNAEQKLAMNGKELTRPEMTRSPDQGAPTKLHEGDLYLCSESFNAMEGALGAVCEGVDAVFQGSANGKGPHRTFVAIRPPGHHCSARYVPYEQPFPDFGRFWPHFQVRFLGRFLWISELVKLVNFNLSVILSNY